jgi:SlyX protein
MSTLESRIDELEIRAAHQDKVIADLNEMITAQWKQIEALQRQLRRLDEEVQSLDQGDVPVTKPPHY